MCKSSKSSTLPRLFSLLVGVILFSGCIKKSDTSSGAVTSSTIFNPSRIPRSTATDDLVLQVVLDRFHDGDPSNNVPASLTYQGEPAQRAGELFDASRTRPHHYWGGDLTGFVSFIPHIASAGFSAVWISPHYLQASARVGDVTAYHGYWPKDWFRVDPHLLQSGSDGVEQFRQVVAELHKHDLKVIIDLVYNHSNPVSTQATDWVEQGRVEKAGSLFATFTDQHITPQQPKGVADFRIFNPALTGTEVHPYCQAVGLAPFFARYCEMTLGTLYSLADFNPYSPQFLDYMKEATAHWLRMGVDGLRLDTFANLPVEAWQDLLGHADSVFRDNLANGTLKPLSSELILIGEYFGAGDYDDSNRSGSPGTNGTIPGSSLDYAKRIRIGDRHISLLDFSLAWRIRQTFGNRGGHEYSVRPLLETASGLGFHDPKDGHLWSYASTVFFNNHDVNLLIHNTWNENTEKTKFCQPLSDLPITADRDPGGNIVNPFRATQQAIAFLLAIRGMPILYYADLQSIQPPCYPVSGEGTCSRPMFPGANGSLVGDSSLAATLKSLSRLRRREIGGKMNSTYMPVFRNGDFRILSLPNSSFVSSYTRCVLHDRYVKEWDRNDLTLAFERCTNTNDDCILYISSVNFAAENQPDDFVISDLRLQPGHYRDALTGKSFQVTDGGSRGREVQVSLRNYETLIMMRDRGVNR